MSNRESFLLRTDPKIMDALRRWAKDDLRSVNAQVEFLLRHALTDAGRLSPSVDSDSEEEELVAKNGSAGHASLED